MSAGEYTLFGRPIDRRNLLALTGKVLAGGAVAGMWISPELASFVQAAARGDKGGSITVMATYAPNTLKWKNYYNLFTKETGIKVNLDDQNYNNQYQKITTQGQSGTHGDDVVAIDTIWTGSFGGAGFTLDLSDFLPQSVKRQIASAAIYSVSFKDKMYGIPAYNSAKHFYYNAKMLQSIGYNRPPKTVDEMIAYSVALQRNKKKLGIQYPMSWSWTQAESLTCDYVQMVDSLGGRFFAPDNATPVFNKGEGVTALQMMKMMLDKGYAAPGSLSHTETNVQNDLLTGKIAMSTNWEGTMAASLNPTQTNKAVLGHIRVALIPGSSKRPSGSCLGPEGWAIMKTSQNQAGAKAFLNWWLTKNAQQQGMLLFDQFPVYSAMYDDPALRRFVQKADGVDDFATYGKQFDYAQARPNFSGYVGASQRLQVHLHKAFLGQESPQKAMDAAVQEIKASSGGGNNP